MKIAETSAEGAAPDTIGAKAGILWIIMAGFLFVTMDACVKTLIQTYSTVQVVWARYFFHVLILAVYLAPRLRTAVATRNLGLQLARSLLLLGTTALFFTGLRYVPLAESSAIMMISPLIVTALAVPVLREKVGPRRWASVVVGLIGAMIIIRPGSDLMQLAILFPTAAACSYAVYQISTRWLSNADPVLTTLFYTATIGALLTTLAVPFYWLAPTPTDWLLMVLVGLFGGLGHFALIKAFAVSEASTIAPFSYVTLIWATGFGYFVFAELPDLWTVMGALIIVTSGLYVYHREQVVRGEPKD